ncbi:glycosyltransferase family 2 protein [Polynucleobacter sp. UK-Kesae-W10]|uniref:glycosyltransferase family 2 protein n=1 Tax=Polynucleobacter sp. UK-Kesae-W10 TaxID=1819738 RepID=UPI001C0B5F81|nr:glycosyltransferase family 2 protein [Polynucleobacter sp. UK-Kesae-W10]MBU3576948.1 glycosyltransferase family 2 protein [Polynucleobacter sp. UK-Kesae-W10]
MTDFIEKKSNLSSVSDIPLVAILLCTYNGARFLAEQLDSLESQTHQNWIVFASDDGSTDQTLEILQQYQAKWSSGKLTIRSGPQKGFCQNFLSLACDPQIKADYYAFCDQDDVWLPSKLEVALTNIITNQSAEVPYLYCGRTKYVTENLKPCGVSPLFVFPPSFRNALVQSIAGGNTMVFNQSAKDLIEKVGAVDVPSHDWWLYQLISGVEGVVFYDNVPQLLYRQHEFALVGGNNSFPAKMERIWMLLRGRFQGWNTQNIEALKQVNHLLVRNNKDTLKMFVLLREARLIDRIRLMQVCGLYRQTRRGTFSLVLAELIKKI